MEILDRSRAPQMMTAHTIRLAVVLMTVLHLVVYWFEPLPGEGNDYCYYILALLGSWLATLLCTLVWRQFRPTEPPYRVWGFFALGLGAWAMGELIWLLCRPYYEAFPEIFVTDFFYLVGYFFYSASIYLQYRLILQPTRRQQRRILGVLCIGAPLAVILLTLGLRLSGLGLEWSLAGMLLYACYPVGDILVGGFGLYLSHLFRRGLWGRAWWGLVAFALSDSFAFWYDMGGYTLLSERADFYLNFLSDTLYLFGYLMVAVACLRQWQLLTTPLPEPLEAQAEELPALEY